MVSVRRPGLEDQVFVTVVERGTWGRVHYLAMRFPYCVLMLVCQPQGSNEGPPPAPGGEDPVTPGGSEESLFDGVSVGGKLYAMSPIETSFQQGKVLC